MIVDGWDTDKERMPPSEVVGRLDTNDGFMAANSKRRGQLR